MKAMTVNSLPSEDDGLKRVDDVETGLDGTGSSFSGVHTSERASPDARRGDGFHDGEGSAVFEVLSHDDRGLIVRELSEGHEYNFYQSFDGSGGPGLALGECHPAIGQHGLDHFRDEAHHFAKLQAARLHLI